MSGRAPSPDRHARSAARLACVQALYELDVSGAECDPVLQGFMADRWSHPDGEGANGETALPPPDRDYLDRLVRGVSERRDDLDQRIGGALTADHSLDRLEVLLRAVLRAGTYELIAAAGVPAKVVINEYMDVAHAFFGGGEPALVNGVLDRIAREIEAEPQGALAHDAPADAN